MQLQYRLIEKLFSGRITRVRLHTNTKAMDIKVKKLPKAEVEINVTFTEDDFKSDMENATKSLSKEVKIDGFRAGNVPYDVLVKHIGKDAIINAALDTAIPRILTDIIQKEKLEVIARPRVDILSKDPITLKVMAPVYPEIKVEGYEKAKVKTKEVKVEEKDIDEALKNVQKQFMEWKQVLRGVKKGDKVELDFEGFDEGGAPLEGTQSKNHPLIIGEGMMVPGFEDEIVNMKTGEEKGFDLTFPADYHKKSFQNKKVKFNVKVNKVEEPELPEINEEFIEKITGKKTPVDNFIKNVKAELEAHKISEEKKNSEQELLEKFLKVIKTDFSDLLIDEEVEYMLHDMKHDMSHKGLSFEQYLQYTKKTEDDIKKELAKEAIKRLTLRFGLNEIMKKEKIEASDKEVDERVNAISDLKPEQKHEARASVINSMRLEQLFDRFIQK